MRLCGEASVRAETHSHMTGKEIGAIEASEAYRVANISGDCGSAGSAEQSEQKL